MKNYTIKPLHRTTSKQHSPGQDRKSSLLKPTWTSPFKVLTILPSFLSMLAPLQVAKAQPTITSEPQYQILEGDDLKEEPLSVLIGHAFNPMHGNVIRSCLITDTSVEPEIAQYPVRRTDINFRSFRDEFAWEASLLREYALTGKASFSAIKLSTNVQSSSSSSNAGSNLEVGAIGRISHRSDRLMDRQPQQGRLTEKAARYLENGQFSKFREYCGLGIITALSKGASLNSEFFARRRKTSSSSQHELLAALDVKYGLASLSASTKQLAKAQETLDQFEIRSKCTADGGHATACDDFTTPGGVAKAMKSLAIYAEQNPKAQVLTSVSVVPYSWRVEDESTSFALEALEEDWRRRVQVTNEYLELRETESAICDQLSYLSCHEAAQRIEDEIEACMYSDDSCTYQETYEDIRIMNSAYIGFVDLYEHANLKGRRLRLKFSVDPEHPGMFPPGEWIDLKDLAFSDVLSSLSTGTVGEHWALEVRSWWEGSSFGGPRFDTFHLPPGAAQTGFSRASNFNDQATYVRLVPRL